MFQSTGGAYRALFAIALFVLLNALSAYADETTDKLNTIIETQKAVQQGQERILSAVTPSNPLASRTFGIEFNPTYALLASPDATVISGGVSLFNIDRQAEIAFPFFYSKDHYQNDSTAPLTVLTLDAQYRYFLGPVQNGWFICAVGRYAYIHGDSGSPGLYGYLSSPSYNTTTAHKIGVAFGIGYRVFSQRHWYWGTSLIAGRYLTDTDKTFSDWCVDCGSALIDIELLKIGYAF